MSWATFTKVSQLGVSAGKSPPLETGTARGLIGRGIGLVNWDVEAKLESNANCKLYLITY